MSAAARRRVGGRARRLLGLVLLAGAVVAVPQMLSDSSDAWPLLPAAAAYSAFIGVALVARTGLAEVGDRVSALDPFLAVGILSGVLVPVLNTVLGPPQVSYRPNAGVELAVTAQWTSFVFFVVVVLAYGLPLARRPQWAAAEVWPKSGLVVVALVLGLVGTWLRYRAGYRPTQLSDPVAEGATGAAGLLGTVLTPLLLVGTFFAVMSPAWRRWNLSRLVLLLVLGPVSIAGLMTYALNRAVLIVPVAAMLVVLVRSGWIRRVGLVATVAIVGSVAIFALVGQLRVDLQREQHGDYVEQATLSGLLLTGGQVYAQSPYLAGSAFEPIAQGAYSTGSLAGSVLSPLPRLGQQFREETGTTLFNTSLGRSEAQDQILPSWAELKLSLGWPGVVGLGLFTAWALRRCEATIRAARRASTVYAAVFACLWLGQLPIISVSILAQIAVYFLAPLLALSLLDGRQQRAEESASSDATAVGGAAGAGEQAPPLGRAARG